MNREKSFEPELTAAQIFYKTELDEAKQKAKKAKKKYHELLEKCKHSVGYRIYWKDEGNSYCIICGQGFGHYCPDAPDKTCHYNTEDNGKILLVSGELVDVPIPENWDVESDGVFKHDPTYETDDCCLFCGAPDERK